MKKAFTLIELLVVLSLVSLLISIVGPSGQRMYKKFERRLKKIENVGFKYDNNYIKFLKDKIYFENNENNESMKKI